MDTEINFNKLKWEKSPYPGVYVAPIDVTSSSIITTHAIKILPRRKIGLHYHRKEPDWIETIYFLFGGHFEILVSARKKILYHTPNPVYLRINSKEKYGIINKSDQDLLLISSMKPGFTNYDEIVDVK